MRRADSPVPAHFAPPAADVPVPAVVLGVYGAGDTQIRSHPWHCTRLLADTALQPVQSWRRRPAYVASMMGIAMGMWPRWRAADEESLKRLMHGNNALAIVLAAIVIFGASISAGAQASKFDAAFAKAVKLANGKDREGALREYEAVFSANNNKDKQLAAEALLRRGEYAWHGLGPNATDEEKKRGLDEALRSWKQLRDNLPDTDAGKRLIDPWRKS